MDDKKLLFIVNPRAGKTKSLAPLFDAAAIYSRRAISSPCARPRTAEKRRSSPNRSGRNSTSSSATAATARSTKR